MLAWNCRAISSWSLLAWVVQANQVWRLIRFMLRASAVIWRAWTRMLGSFWERWINPMLIASMAWVQLFRLTKNQPAVTHARRWRRWPRFTTICDCCLRASVCRTVQFAAKQCRGAPPKPSSKKASSSMTGTGFYCWRQLLKIKKVNLRTSLSSTVGWVMLVLGLMAWCMPWTNFQSCKRATSTRLSWWLTAWHLTVNWLVGCLRVWSKLWN